MRRVRAWLLRIAGLFGRDRRDRELAEEFESHLQLQIEANLRPGMPLSEARRMALIHLGGIESAKDEYRDRRGLPTIEILFQDLRFAARVLRKSPGFSLAAILALALGIGANTAVFSVINGILLKPLGFKNADALIRLWERGSGLDHAALAYPNFKDWKELNNSFEQMAAFRDTTYSLTGSEAPERLFGRQVSANFLSTLEVSPAIGRDFTADDDRTGANLVVLISDGLWTRSFGREPSVPGKTITLNDDSYAVIGVLPKDFHFYSNADVLAPLSAKRDPFFGTRAIHPGIQAIGRLRPGVSIAQADADMNAIAAALAAQYPDTNQGHSVAIASLKDDIVGDAGHLLSILLAAVAFVLLIACANVANLMLARAATRREEIAIRSALGASRLRTVQMLIIESLLLSLAGGAFGLVAAYWGTGIALKALPKVLPRASEIDIDLRVLGFTIAASLLTGIIFGLAPALQAARTDLNEVLKKGGRSASRAKQKVRAVLVITEMALALVLLVGAGLLLRSLAKLYQVNPGFDPSNLLTFRIDLSPGAFPDATAIRSFYKNFPARITNLPGVQAVAAASVAPLNGYTIDFPFYISGRPAPSQADMAIAMSYITSPGYLDAMRMPLIQGRFFDERDTEKTPAVTVIDQTLARQYFPNDDAIGNRITVQGGKDVSFELQIIGIVGHVKQENLDTESGGAISPQMYTSLGQLPDQLMMIAGRNMNWLVRTSSDPRSYVSAIRSELSATAPQQLMFAVAPMEEAVSNSMGDRRFVLTLLVLFSLVSMVLASIGTYGVMSYSVAQRKHEIGICMALGASRRQVLGQVLRDGALIAVIGVVVGAIGAALLTRFMSGFLYGVSPTDPLTFAAIATFLSCVALAASYIPARRATRVDPMVALRYE